MPGTCGDRRGSTSAACCVSNGPRATWCCSATRPRRRTSRSARVPSSRWRARSRSPSTCTPSRRWASASGATRRSAGRRCCGCRARPATRPNGSSTWSAMCISIRCNSTTRSSRAPSASAMRTFERATAHGSRARRCGSKNRQRAGSRERRAPPMFTPFRLRDLELKNRIVVSPMAQYTRRGRHADRLAFRPPAPSAPRAAPVS